MAKLISPKHKILKSDIADGYHVIGKNIFSYNFTSVCPICMKFCTKTQNRSAMTV